MKWGSTLLASSLVLSLAACGPAADANTAKSGAKDEVPAEAKKEGADKPRIPFSERAPKVGERAPVHTFATLAGDSRTVPMPDARGPTVVIFGSFS